MYIKFTMKILILIQYIVQIRLILNLFKYKIYFKIELIYKDFNLSIYIVYNNILLEIFV